MNDCDGLSRQIGVQELKSIALINFRTEGPGWRIRLGRIRLVRIDEQPSRPRDPEAFALFIVSPLAVHRNLALSVHLLSGKYPYLNRAEV